MQVALALCAWDGFQHTMRQGRAAALAEAVGARVAWARARLPGTHGARAAAADGVDAADAADVVEYDVRLVDADGRRHVRVHATDARRCYHVVVTRDADAETAASVRASLHPKRTCRLLTLADVACADVVVDA